MDNNTEFDNAQVMHCQLTLQGQLLAVNTVAEHLFQQNNAQLCQQSWLSLISPTDRAHSQIALQQLQQQPAITLRNRLHITTRPWYGWTLYRCDNHIVALAAPQAPSTTVTYETLLVRCAQRLLEGYSSDTTLQDMLRYVQHELALNRVSIALNHEDKEQGLIWQVVTQASENATNATLLQQKIPYQPHFIHWQQELEQGHIIHSQVSQLSVDEKKLCNTQHSQSVLLLPLYEHSHWYGFLWLESAQPHAWQAEDLHHLNKLTDLLNAYFSRAHNEKQWREQESRYHAVVAAMQEGVLLWYVEAGEGICNEQAEALLSCDSTQIFQLIQATSDWHLFDAKGQRLTSQNNPFVNCLQQGQTFHNLTLGVQWQTQTLRWLQVNIQPLWQSTTSYPQAIVATFVDITNLKQSEAYYHATFSSAAVGIAVLRTTGEYLQCNNQWLAMLKVSRQQLRQQHLRDHLHHADVDKAMALLNSNFINNGAATPPVRHVTLRFICRNELICRDGQVCWTTLHVSPIQQPDGKVDAVMVVAVDINEHYQLQQQREQLFNFSRDLQCIGHFDGYLQQVNPAWQHTLGWDNATLLKRPFLTFVAHEDRPSVGEMFTRLQCGQTVEAYEFRLRCADASTRWMSCNAYPLVEQQTVYAIIRDTTLSKRYEMALSNTHERLLRILDGLEALVCVIDMRSYKLLYINEYGQRTFGDVVGRHYSSMQHRTEPTLANLLNEDNDAKHPTQDRTLADSVITSEVQNITTGRWYLTQDRVVRWVDGRWVRLQIATDITERKQAEEALRLNEARYLAIIQDQTELICRFAPDRQLTFVNQAFCRYYQQTEADLLSQTFHPALYAQRDQEQLNTTLQKLNQTQPVIAFDCRAVIMGNQLRWQEWSVRALFNSQGRLTEYQAVGRDVTQHKHTEARLIQARDSAEAATRAKSEFLANMSHEIRTPMNGVMGMTELLLNAELSPRQYEYAKIIHQSTQALQTIINDILDFSKIEAGKLTLDPKPFNLETAVMDVARLLAVNAAEKSIEMNVRYAPHAPRYLVGDGGRIRQIMTNLVGNAVKFTQQGYVLIDVDYQAHSEAVAEHNTNEENWADMQIRIEDTGIGIPTEKLELIFDKFTQADSSTTRHFGGTGLGLAISQQLVKLMRGEIKAHSRQNIGSVFSFTLPLPLAEEPQEELEFDSEQLSHLHNTRVLVVDDHGINLRVISEQLENLRIRCDTYNNASAAINALQQAKQQQDPYWLVIIDYFMPQTNGLQLGKQIRTNAMLADTALFMLSSAGYQINSQPLQQAGFDAHLLKPLSQQQLQQTLLRLRLNYEQQRYNEFITMDSLTNWQHAFSNDFTINKNFNATILLVEDDGINRLVATNILDTLGCSTVEAVNGKQAVEKLQTDTFDVVFMDVQMPEMDGYAATRTIREHERQQARQPATIVAMTANAMQGDAERCLEAGMDDYIAKPISIERLFHILEKYIPSAQQTMLEDEHGDDIAESTDMQDVSLSSDPANSTTCQVLLVEDNEINRMVASNMLEALNCTVDIACNGEEALEFSAQKDYQLIFMDIQMPVLDGVSATQGIRAREAQRNSPRTPIVALTANTLPTDVKRYYEAGMDDCIGKPVIVEQLQQTLARFAVETVPVAQMADDIDHDTSTAHMDDISTSASHGITGISTESAFLEFPIFDSEQARRIAIGNMTILQKVVAEFRREIPNQLEKIIGLIAIQDYTQIERLAHSLKGSTRSIGALRLGEIAHATEQAAKAKNWARLTELYPQLESNVDALFANWEEVDWAHFL